MFQRSILLASTLLIGACASSPSQPAHASRAEDSAGIVIGTVTCPVGSGSGGLSPLVLLRFERVDRPGAVYLVTARVDAHSRRGYFTSALPAGAYALRDAQADGAMLAAVGLRMPFEVRSGAVNDLGHYNLDTPVPAFIAARWSS